MKITGRLQGVVSHKWTGGRRIAIQHRPRLGQVVSVGGVTLRIVDIYYDPAHTWTDSFVAMRDGWIARLVGWYVRWLHQNAAALFAWECKWIRNCKPQEGGFYPKWSIPSILLRPLL